MIRTTLLSLLVLAVCGSAQSAGPYVTGTYKPLAQGYGVEFTVHNELASASIAFWEILTDDASDISLPDHWIYYQDFRTVDWQADSTAYWIKPCAELGGFGFISQAQTSSYYWFVMAAQSYTGSVTLELVPEPSALLAMAAALSTLTLCHLRRRRRS